MQKSLLSSVLQTAGFATIGFLFLIWYMGHKENTKPMRISADTPAVSRAEVGVPAAPREAESGYVERSYASSGDYASRDFKMPESVTRGGSAYSGSAAVERENTGRSDRSSSRSVEREAAEVRSWKGVHRDESFAWLSFERYAPEIIGLSREHGLYPDVFMARVIAYSYEFTEDPRVDPTDNNVPALPHPKSRERARFRSAAESLKAYAVVHAGEVNRLSREGAIAKNDRAWTMRKIIDGYAFVGNLAAETAGAGEYSGRIGTANKKSDAENYQREMVGEAIRMTSTVDDIVRKRRAESAGYSNWEDYMDDLSDDERRREQEEANAATSAISKKKAFNLSRRVAAKKQD